MKITKRQLRRIIRESAHDDRVSFKWSPSGLAMNMSIDGNKVMSFSSQSEVENLIAQLEELLAGPMRASP